MNIVDQKKLSFESYYWCQIFIQCMTIMDSKYFQDEMSRKVEESWEEIHGETND